MSLPNEVISSFLGAGGGQQYRIEKSVRLRASASGYFSKLSTGSITPADTSYYKKTYSAWVKRGAISSIQHIITNSYDVNNRWQIDFNASDQIFILGINAGSYILNLNTLAVFRDTSAWYHIVVTVDTTLATATDRIKLYVNGVLQTLTGTVAPLNNQNAAALFIAPTTANVTWYNRIGNEFVNGEGAYQFDGYIAELNAVDGQALLATSFGEFDLATGVWKPKRYEGSYGNNGYRLNFNTASLSTELQLSATASVGAPGLASGSSADFAKAIDTSVVSTNVTTGANFDIIKYDLGSVQQITRFFAGGLYFSGASTTNSRILYSEDNVTYKVAQALAVNTTSTDFSGNLNVKARYVKINIDGFGTNGRGFIESLILYQDGIGLDASGNGNNFTPTNISVTSGITYDSMFDVPTPYADGNNGRGNYATWNPLNYDKGSGTPGTGRLLTGGNLNLAYAYSTWAGYRSTIAVSSGKWYVEMTCTAGGGGYNTTLDALPTSQALSLTSAIQVIPTSGSDVLAIALNLDAGTWTTYRNNAVVSTGTTTAGTEYIFRVTAGNGVNTFTNFGQRPFTYTPPAGHKALHTGNLPIPTIGATNATQARSYFNAYTYTGNGRFLKYGSLPKRDRKDSSSTVSNSLRFKGGELYRAPIAGATPTKWGMSFWIKPTTGGAIYSSGAVQNGVYETYAALRVFTDQINIWDITNSGNYPLNIVAKYNFNSDNWYNIAVSCDTTLATAADRVKIYVDGKRLTNFTTATYYSLNYATRFNSNLNRYIGHLPPDGYAGAAFSTFNGYLADFYFIDGNSIVPESFGQYNSDNIWVPLEYQGIYGPAGWRLKFDNFTSVITTIGYDYSGNLNNWTANGFNDQPVSEAYDKMFDSPCDYNDGADSRGNFATLSQYPSGSATITDALLTFNTGVTGSVFGNFALTSGKWYWEVKPSSASTSAQRYVGIICEGLILYYWLNGTKEINGTNSGYGSAYTTNDIIGVALDIDGKTVTFFKNNVSQGAISFSQTGQFTSISSSGGNAASSGYYNFGQRPFVNTPPTGYKSINTYNFTKASTFWWGDGTGPIPDLLWIKNRILAGSANRLADSVRGFGLALTSNSGEIETPVGIGRVDKFGIGFNGDTNVDGGTQSHALWAWKAGSISTNTNGSITSTVNVNQSAGFSIVNYIGNATTATVGHGLGVAPSFIIVKGRTNSVDWQTYHVSLGINYTTNLNLTNASNNIANYWGASNPTSTTFGIISSYSGVNTSGVNYIAYCWAAVPGYSKFGSYTGNGSADGTFVYCGFRPRFIMFKSTSVAGNWFIRDTSRDTYNAATQSLYPSLTDTEFTGGALDILSNGFKARAATSGLNGSGETIIYAAFAESPFKYSLAR